MRKGFTLIEMIVVISIIAVLSAIITPNAFRAIEKSKIAKALSDIKTLKASVYSCYADTGMWALGNSPPLPHYTGLDINRTVLLKNPSDSDWQPGLTNYALCFVNAGGWDGPYLEGGQLLRHSWGGLFQFNNGRNWTGDAERDLVVTFTNWCLDAGTYKCGIPQNSAIIIDQKIDDGNLTTGEVRKYTSTSNPAYVELGIVITADVY